MWIGWMACAFKVELCGDGFKPWLEQSLFIFAKIYSSMDMKRHVNPRVYGSKGGWKTEGNRPLSDVNDRLIAKIRFSAIQSF